MPEGGTGHAALERWLTQHHGERGLRGVIHGGGLVGYSISMREPEAERFLWKLEGQGASEGIDFALVKGQGGAFEPVPPWLEQLTSIDGEWVALARENLNAGPLGGYRLKP